MNSGRKKGSVAKLTFQARARLEELGCDPLEGMALLAMDPKSSPELRGKMFAELAKFVYPQVRAIEHSAAGGGVIVVKRLIGVNLEDL